MAKTMKKEQNVDVDVTVVNEKKSILRTGTVKHAVEV